MLSESNIPRFSKSYVLRIFYGLKFMKSQRFQKLKISAFPKVEYLQLTVLKGTIEAVLELNKTF